MFEADEKYTVTIVSAALGESPKGTPGLHVKLAGTEEKVGSKISHTLWLSEAARERAAKTLMDLGISKEILGSREFWEDPDEFLSGLEARITTKSKERNGKTYVEVKWLSGPGDMGLNQKVGLASEIAGIFAAMEDVPF